jgi:hypothetical protein
MSFSHANCTLRVGSGCHRRGQQPSGQRKQVESAIEPVGDRAQIALGILAKVEGVVRAAQAALHIAEDRIDPVQHGHFFGLAPANDERLMETPGVRDAGKAG